MSTQATNRDLTSIILTLIVLSALLYTSYLVLLPFLPALIWSSMIVIAGWSFMLKVQGVLWGRRGLAVLFMSGVLILLLLLPLTIGISAVVQNIDRVTEMAKDVMSNGVPNTPSWVVDIPVVGERLAKRWDYFVGIEKEEIVSKLSPYIGGVLGWIVQRAGSFGQLLVHFLLT